MRRVETNPAIPGVTAGSEARPARSPATRVTTAKTAADASTRASGTTGARGAGGGRGARAGDGGARGATGPRREHGGTRGHGPHPGKAAWYLPAALAADTIGLAVPAALVLRGTGQPHPLACALVAAAAWPAVRAFRRRYAAAALGETRRALPVLGDWAVLLGLLAVLRTAFGEIAEPSLGLLAVAAAPALTAACGRLTHRHLIAARRSAQAVRRVLVVGEPGTADHVVGHLAARTEHPYVVVGVVPVGSARLECAAPVSARLAPVAPQGPADDAALVLRAAREHSAELVLAAAGPRLSADRLRRLAWWLHDAGLPLAVLPGLVDVAVHRLRVDAPAGLTVLHMAPPVRHGLQPALKSAVDRTGAALGLLLLAPVFALLATAIRLGSRGPVFHRQVRYGRDCVPFTMWKFRTMVVDAEDRKADLLRTGANESDGLMFKMRVDPRVTAVGRVLRRLSLDELPQLLNVLRGEMALVGPRPPLPEEVAGYDEVALRRLSVRPGMTGLWQISGRSELSWDETLALDLRYVDNWSLAGDADVLARTLRAVVDGRGAY